MTLKVAIQMDPIGPINIDADSTFRIALEAQARGHELFYYTPDRLAFQEGRVTARGWPLTVRRVKGITSRWAMRRRWTWGRSMWSGCGRTRPSTWDTSRRRIFST